MAAYEARKNWGVVNLPVLKLQPLKQVLDIQPKVGPTIFACPRGKPRGNTNLHLAMVPCRKKANADDLHWHDLRGTLVSLLAEAGCSEIQIAAITGHSEINSQVSGYLNMGRNLAIEAYSKLDEFLLQKQTNYFLIGILIY